MKKGNGSACRLKAGQVYRNDVGEEIFIIAVFSDEDYLAARVGVNEVIHHVNTNAWRGGKLNGGSGRIRQGR